MESQGISRDLREIIHINSPFRVAVENQDLAFNWRMHPMPWWDKFLI
jgi:hypothetical protein